MWPAKWQRNALFEAVVAGGLDATECAFEYDEGGARIRHLPSDSYFFFEEDHHHFTWTAVVGEHPSWQLETFDWPTLVGRARRWAKEVKQDFETPDLWAQVERERELFMGGRSDDFENTPFTPDEQAEIAEQVRQIKEFVKTTYSLSDARMQSLEAKLDEMQAASARIGRKDWQLLFCGVMFTLGVEVLLPPEAVRHILVMTLTALDHLFGVGGTPELPAPDYGGGGFGAA